MTGGLKACKPNCKASDVFFCTDPHTDTGICVWLKINLVLKRKKPAVEQIRKVAVPMARSSGKLYNKGPFIFRLTIARSLL